LKPRFLLLLVLLGCAALASSVAAQPTSPARRTNVAVLDFGETATGASAALKFRTALAADAGLSVPDRDESRAAARGSGYAGSLNLTLVEARDLGSALGVDFYLLGDAQTLRRSRSDRPAYFESAAAVFLVSSRTGRLIMWERPSAEEASPEAAERRLLAELERRAASYAELVRAAEARERDERAEAIEHRAPLVEDAPMDESPAALGLRLPAPYRRVQPAYPETAARAGVEAVVDAQVEVDAAGEVARVEVVRWAGYGLDEATVSVIRQLHFRPATRDGSPVPLRVLLRYNFRRPPGESQKATAVSSQK
jgi:TonB family protein